MTRRLFSLALLLAAMLVAPAPSSAQQVGSTGTPPTPVTLQIQYPLTPIASTNAVNTQTTLTIPAPGPGLYNYVCMLEFIISMDGTATVQTNVVTTSTNFNTFALKWSAAATANTAVAVAGGPIVFGNPATGCAKSTASATATTFVSPAAATNAAYTWLGSYYQAP